MAIYHMSAQAISRKNGGNAVAAAAYRAGERLGKFDYTRKCGVDHAEILTPDNSPEWCRDREKLWTAVEASEKRVDAQVCREINVALPLELKPSERVALVQDYARQFVSLGMVVDIAIHHQGGNNPHAHMMLTMRELTPEGFGKKNRDWNSRDLLQKWREQWTEIANMALERAGHEVRIDHRSFEAQGVNQEPTRHQGKTVTAMERKGRQTLVGSLNAAIKQQAQDAHEVARCRAELAILERLEREQAQKGPERPLEGTQAKKAEQRTPETEKPATGQTRGATPPEKPKPLKGAELLPVIDRLRRETGEAYAALQTAGAQQRRMESALANARRAIEQHNTELKNSNFLKQVKMAWNSSKINARGEELKKDESAAIVANEAANKELALASSTYRAKQAELEKVLAEYEKSPHGLEVKAEKQREMEWQRMEQSIWRQLKEVRGLSDEKRKALFDDAMTHIQNANDKKEAFGEVTKGLSIALERTRERSRGGWER